MVHCSGSLLVHDMFHDMFVHQSGLRRAQVCFTICLFISPDLDGYRAVLP